jgi:tetratricopeptide (TPR) repeat protein
MQSPWLSYRLFGAALAIVLIIPTLSGNLHVRAQGQPSESAAASNLSDAARAKKLDERGRMRAEVTRLARAGRLDEAAVMLTRELAASRELMGELHEDVVGSLQMLAMLKEARQDWEAAREALREVITIRERQPDRKDWRIGDARRALVDLDRRSTFTLAQRKRLQEADRLNRLQAALFKQGKYGDGIPVCTKALEIRGGLLGKNHPDYAQSLNNLAELYQAMGDYAKAEPLFRQALEIWRRVLGENHPAYATALNNLAGLYDAMGDYAKAEPLYRQALEIRRRALGENHPDYATSLNNLAGLFQAMGDYAKAEPLYRQALEIRRRVQGENHPDYAQSLNNLALLYQAMGDYAKAEPLYRQALEIWRRVLGENHPVYAISLNNLAGLYMDMGDYAKAEPLCRQAMEILRRALGENHPEYATSLNNLGLLYHDMGDYAKADPLFRQALEIERRAQGENHPDYATSLNNLAMLYQDMGNYPRAEPLIRQAMEVRGRVLGENHPDYAQSLNNLAGLYVAMGDYARAKPLLRQALAVQTRFAQEALSSVGERQRVQLIATLVGSLHGYLSVAVAAGVGPEEIYSHVLDFKGVVEAREDEDSLARDRPELRETLERLAQARAGLARLAFATPSEGRQQEWRKQLDALHDRKENLESELARRSSAFRRVQESRRLGAAEVTASLPPESALVDLLDYVHSSPPKGGKGPFEQERRLVAFVLRRDRAPVLVPLGASAPVDSAAGTWRQALAQHEPERTKAAALGLSRLVWEPLTPHLEGALTVLVSPDGLLTGFPFAALPGKRPGSYLIEDLAIGYVGSGRRLVEAAAAAESDASKPRADAGLLAIGGIDYRADPGGAAPTESHTTPSVLVADSQRAGFRPLAGTGPEVRHIGELFEAAFPQQHALVMTGSEPRAGAVKQKLGGHWRYLHLATHGFFESPARIAALRAGLKSESFGFGRPGAARSDESASLALAPLLHSGLALVGAGHKPDDQVFAKDGSLPDREDGILTAEEVQSSDLRGTELVVLSACETGLGQGYYGQGVMGLQRAFQSAGARAVVASLWKVDDAATSMLMEQFYTNLWVKKMPKLEALRQAQLSVLNNPGLVTARRAEPAGAKPPGKRELDDKPIKLPKGELAAPSSSTSARSDPALWAAFVLSGDTR